MDYFISHVWQGGGGKANNTTRRIENIVKLKRDGRETEAFKATDALF